MIWRRDLFLSVNDASLINFFCWPAVKLFLLSTHIHTFFHFKLKFELNSWLLVPAMGKVINVSPAPSHEPRNAYTYIKYGSLLVLVIQTTTCVLLLRYSKHIQPGVGYLSSTTILLSEIIKLFTCVFILSKSEGKCAIKIDLIGLIYLDWLIEIFSFFPRFFWTSSRFDQSWSDLETEWDTQTFRSSFSVHNSKQSTVLGTHKFRRSYLSGQSSSSSFWSCILN